MPAALFLPACNRTFSFFCFVPVERAGRPRGSFEVTVQAHPAEFVGAGQHVSMLWLLGQPHLEEYLSFVARRVVGGDQLPVLALADEWRAANDHYYHLEQTEAGDADRVRTRTLPARLAARAKRVLADPHFGAIFDSVPTTIEMVELDRLIVWQGSVDDTFALARGASLGARPDPARLFDYCLPLQRDPPPFTMRRLGSDHYQIVSDATDLSAQSPRLLDAAARDMLATTGPVAAALAVPIAFGANFMSAIRSDDRLLLHNGYHRAYALRAAGVRYAPCIVQTVTRRDELKLIADTRVASDPAFYFRAARPPMLRDFFDPKLAKQLTVHPIRTVIDVRFTATSWLATDLPEGQRG